jgi:hypothetical protein
MMLGSTARWRVRHQRVVASVIIVLDRSYEYHVSIETINQPTAACVKAQASTLQHPFAIGSKGYLQKHF